MTPEERKALIESIKQAFEEKLKAAGITDNDLIAKLRGRLDALEQIVADGPGSYHPAAIRGAAPLLRAFESDAFKQRLNAVREGAPTTGLITLQGVGVRSLKATIVNLPDGGSPAQGVPTAAERAPGYVGPVQRRLTLLDALQSIVVSSNVYEYVRVSHVNASEIQADEGGASPEGSIESTLVQTPIAQAHEHLRASVQVLSDNPQLATFLQQLLAYDLREQIEEKVLRGEHEEAEKFDGILELASEIVTESALAPDIISEGIAIMTALGYNPAFVVLHPLDAHRLRTLKAAGGSEEYLSGGSWSNSTGQNVWNTPVVESPALTQGEALLIDPAFVKVLDREQVQVAISGEDRDNLIKRLVTLAGWARFGVAVFDTNGVGKLNLPVPSP